MQYSRYHFMQERRQGRLPRFRSFLYIFALTIALIFLSTNVVLAQDSSAPLMDTDLKQVLDTGWLVLTGTLVFFMNAGFCMLETGFCRKQNAVNILAKNLVVFSIAVMSFWLVGAGIMFGEGAWIGTNGFLYNGTEILQPSEDGSGSLAASQAQFFFQVVFAGTAATIVSGAVAERMKFVSFLVFSCLLVGIFYPITGHWIWSDDGWLTDITFGQQSLGFWDFAGSTVVHMVGGSAGLMGAIALGPRIEKYIKVVPYEFNALSPRDRTKFGRKVESLDGHDITLATLGCFILWLGWFGFNPGSTLEATVPATISHVFLTTNIAAAAGGIGSIVFCFVKNGKPSLAFIINGILGGLVSITAPCAFVSLPDAVLIGALGGGVVVPLLTRLLDWWEIDDPVGAVPVHLGCGIWGTLAVGLFSIGPDSGYDWAYTSGGGPDIGLLSGGDPRQLIIQFLGVVTVFLFISLFSGIAFYVLNLMADGIRVSDAEELDGLDKFTFEDRVQDVYQDQIDSLKKEIIRLNNKL
ncbi:MAG: ammonium transporter [Leptolyngbyaceae cyanobacterium]